MVHPLILWGFEFGLQYVLRLRREGVYLTNPWMGDLLALLYVAMVLAAARVTFWRIEEPGRLWAKRIAAK
jgi:peptidoglycan/LPS O-acetylase OafA/YrhL